MNGQSSLLLKDACKVERRRVNCRRNVVEREGFRHSRGEIYLCRLGALNVVLGSRYPSSRLGAVSLKCVFKYVGDKLQSRHIRPEWFERLDLCIFEPPDKLAVTPKDRRLAW